LANECDNAPDGKPITVSDSGDALMQVAATDSSGRRVAAVVHLHLRDVNLHFSITPSTNTA